MLMSTKWIAFAKINDRLHEGSSQSGAYLCNCWADLSPCGHVVHFQLQYHQTWLVIIGVALVWRLALLLTGVIRMGSVLKVLFLRGLYDCMCSSVMVS